MTLFSWFRKKPYCFDNWFNLWECDLEVAYETVEHGCDSFAEFCRMEYAAYVDNYYNV